MTDALDTKSFLRNSVFLFIATQCANVATMLFQVVTGRKLSVEEYGVLGAMMSIFLIAATPLDALRTAMAHFATRAMRKGDTGAIRWIVMTWSLRMVGLALLLVAAGYLGRDKAAWFFRMDSGAPFVVACGLIAITFFTPLLSGVFQGMQNFYWMSVSMHTWAMVRLGLVWLFMAISPTAISGLVSHAVATSIGIVLSLIGVHLLTRDRPAVQPPSGIGSFFVRSLFMLGSYAVLMNADLIFVKHLFSPEQAGEFARAAIIGRSVIFLPMPIALVMFPRVISSGPSSRDSRITLIKALSIVALLIGSAVAAIMVVPWLPMWVMYGIREPSAESVRLLIMVVCAMAPLALTFLLLNYEMAQHRFGLVYLLAGCALAYIGGVMIWNDTMEHVVWVLGSVSTVSAVGFMTAIMVRTSRRPQHATKPVEAP